PPLHQLEESMKTSVLLAGCFVSAAAGATSAFAQNSRAVSVVRFDEQAQHILDSCKGFNFTIQDQLRTVLERDLGERGVQVVERRDIRKIYDNEYEMPNLNQETQAKRMKFIAAKYTISGGITEMGICEKSSGNGVQLGGIVSLLG